MAIEKKKEKIKVAIVDVTSKAENEARDLAESKMQEDKSGLKGFRGLLKKIWRHNLARGWYIRREYDKAKQNILARQNLFANERDSTQKHAEIVNSITNRFVSEYEETVHLEAGEKKEKLGESAVEKEIKSEIEGIIKEYVRFDLSQQDIRDSFENEKNAVLSRLKGIKKETIGKGSMLADNLFEVVKQVQQSLEHGKKLEDLDLDFEVIVGQAKDRVRTEAQYSTVDRIVEKITQSRFGCLVNEATLASALSLVWCLGGKLGQSIGRSRLLAWGTFGATAVLGSGVAALREHQMFEEDRKRHLRDIAQGKKFDLKNKPRRAEMEVLQYESRGANELGDNLEQALYTYNDKGEKQIKKLSKEDLQNVLNYLVEIEARIALSDRAKIDLINYSEKNKSEQEGLRLDLLRAQAKVDLEKYFALGQKLAVEILKGRSFQDFFRNLNETKIENLTKGEGGIEAKNRIARKMRQKKVAWAAVKGLGTGLAIGATVQEALAVLNGSEESLIGQLFGIKEAYAASAASPLEPQRYTALGYFYRYMTGNFPRMDAQHMQDFVFGEQHFNLPRGASLVKNSDGTLCLLRGEEIFIERIPVDARGHLTPEGKSLLASHDVKISGPGIGGPGHPHDLAPKDYILKNKGLFRHVKRMLWYDNDTPAPVFDKNELKLWWGGKNGTGIDANGNYVFNIKHMTPDGSYHKNFSVNAQEAMKSGKLKMLLSLSRDTQCDVVEIPIDANGNAVIDPNSEVGKTFFKTVAGKNGPKAVFTGKFAEVAQMMGEKNGVDQVRILATHVGKGVTGVKWVPPVIFDMPAPVTVEPPPFIPAFGRWPLERPDKPIIPYLSGYFPSNRENVEYYKKRQSKALENPNVKLDNYKEVENYFNRINPERKRRTQDFCRQISEPMNPNCKMAVCIPVAGHQEGRNIYNTLEWYKNQTDLQGKELDKSLYEIILFVNHPSDKQLDNTLDEIQRFQRENPDMPIRLVYEKFDRSEARLGNMRKYATDIALMRHHALGENKGDLIIVSNDADCKGLCRSYLANFLEKLKDPKTEGVLGKIEWEPEAYLKSPLLFLGIRLFQYIDAAYRHAPGPRKNIGFSGANFAFKSSLYAAVGGYDENDVKAEDVSLGNMMKYARKGTGELPLKFGGIKSLLYTSARRVVETVKSGRAPAEMWYEFGPDDALRAMDWEIRENEDILKMLNDKGYQEKLREGLEIFINRTFREYNLAPNSPEAKKTLRFYGVKHIVRGERVIVTDMRLVIEWLKEYQKRALQIRERNLRK